MQKEISARTLRMRRSIAVLIIVGVSAGAQVAWNQFAKTNPTPTSVLSDTQVAEGPLAKDILNTLTIKGRAPKTGYARSEFGEGWATVSGCDMRNIILKRSLTETELSTDGCVVLSGMLADPYTGTNIEFQRGASTSADVQIDHVVALSDAWQKGAQSMPYEQRVEFANDPLNLLAVDGEANQKKGDSDAASWLKTKKG